jgi:hypothetical protein
MITKLKGPAAQRKSPAWHVAFLAMLPAIRRQAAIAFRAAPPELREELIAAVTANCMVAFVRLIELGKSERAFPSALARYGILQVRAGRRVGTRLRVGELLSRHAQRRKGFSVDSLDHFDRDENGWREIILEDRRAGPAEIAACRIDFADWLRQLPARLREIALILAGGESTSGTALMFGVTAARISQLRLWLKESWLAFQGEADSSERPRLVAA